MASAHNVGRYSWCPLVLMIFGLVMIASGGPVWAQGMKTGKARQAHTVEPGTVALAKTAIDEAERARSLLLVNLAREQNLAGNSTTALLLALEALPDLASNTSRVSVVGTDMQFEAAWTTLREQIVLHGHTGSVQSAVFSPDGSRIVTASRDTTARIWDAKSGMPIGKPLAAHAGAINSVAFRSDGKRLLTASDDQTIRLWDATNGTPVGNPLASEKGAVRSAVFSPDGKLVLAIVEESSQDRVIELFDLASQKPLGKPFHDIIGRLDGVAFSPDGKTLVTLSDGQLRLWDVQTQIEIEKPKEAEGDLSAAESTKEQGPVTSAAFSPVGTIVITGSGDGTMRIWDIKTLRPLGEPFKGHAEAVIALAFSSNGKLLASGAKDGTLSVWQIPLNVSTGEVLGSAPVGKALGRHPAPITSIAFNPDGNRVVATSRDRAARVWDAGAGKIESVLLEGDPAYRATLSPDGKYLATVSKDSPNVLIRDGETGKLIREIATNQGSGHFRATFSPDGARIATTSVDDNSVQFWNAATGKAVGEPLVGHQGSVVSVKYSRDGKRIVTASFDGTARQWDAATGKPIGEPLVGRGGTSVYSAEFSPDGTRIATAGTETRAHIWDAATNTPVGDPLEHDAGINSVAFSADGAYIVTASDDNTARLWIAATGEPYGVPLKGHGGSVYGAAFSPDGRRVVTASEDGTVRIWEMSTGMQIGDPLRGDGSEVISANYSPDGRRIITTSTGENVRFWQIPALSPEAVAQAKAHVSRCLAQDERQRFFLPAPPPRWCITGAGKEAEKDAAMWTPKWPYDGPKWKNWLARRDAGETLPPPH
jgi:WD40 repeat protein